MNQIEVSPGGVQALSNEVNSAEESIAIVINGDTAPKAISKGQYLFIKNHSTLATGGYHATAAISSGQSVAGSVAADSDGICNVLNSKTMFQSSTGDVLSTAQGLSVGETKLVYFETSATSKPSTHAGFGVCYRAPDTQNNLCRVTFYDVTDGTVWINARYGGAWTGWEQLALNSKLTPDTVSITKESSIYSSSAITGRKVGRIVTISFNELKAGSNISLWTKIGTSASVPNENVYFILMAADGSIALADIAVSGNINVYSMIADKLYYGSVTFVSAS